MVKVKNPVPPTRRSTHHRHTTDALADGGIGFLTFTDKVVMILSVLLYSLLKMVLKNILFGFLYELLNFQG